MWELLCHNETVISSLLLAIVVAIVAGSLYKIRIFLLRLMREKWRELSCFLLFGWIFLPLYSLYFLLYKLPRQLLKSNEHRTKFKENSLRKLTDLIIFTTSNIILNGSDVILDGLTAWSLSSCNHPVFAGITMLWIFTPFLYSLPSIIATLSFGGQLVTKKTFKNGVKNAWIHLPLVIPVKNIYHAYELYQMDYSGQMTVANRNKIEKIYKEGKKE